MILLKKVEIEKYKSFSKSNSFEVEDDITILVGMNESGKTSILEAIAKTNYFQTDNKFEFTPSLEYPRKEYARAKKAESFISPIKCTYRVSEALNDVIQEKFGTEFLGDKFFGVTIDYKNNKTISIKSDERSFFSWKLKQYEIDNNDILEKLSKIKTLSQLKALQTEIEGLKESFWDDLVEYFSDKCTWDTPIKYYLYNQYLQPNLPKFLYYDEYYALPSRISLTKLQQSSLEETELKTAKALLDLAGIEINEILGQNSFEDFIAELESTSASISQDLFEYWGSNKNLSIEFAIDKQEDTSRTKIVEKVLDIRVKNNNLGISLPLSNRSKGFNWFFSFLVWFKKIQEDSNSKYILLLDEPGLNLHASAQENLLNFLEDLSKDYQIIYTTHSPFMIPNQNLNRVRTVVESKEGSIVSDTLQEKDPNTLFPLQAALGYDIAQNLFISKKNLLVEGIADLVYLTAVSAHLMSLGREGLNESITIVPVGGLDKVSSFISLLRGSKLSIACLLDTPNNASSQKLKQIVETGLLKQSSVYYFDKYREDYAYTDIEDMFENDEYIKFYNLAFNNQLNLIDLNSEIKPILKRIEKFNSDKKFNHYLPAQAFLKHGIEFWQLSPDTLTRFEDIFKDINNIFAK